MFINCPHCRGLIATDPATDLPPPRCPRCAAQLDAGQPAEPSQQAHDMRGPDAAAIDAARSGVAAAIEDAFGPARDAHAALLAQPAVSVASLLRTGSDVAAEGDAPPPDAAAPIAADAAPHPAASSEAAVASAAADAPARSDAVESPADPPPPSRRGGKPAPSFARARRIAADAPAGRRWVMPAAIVGLAVLLGVQWLLADRARLAADPAWRPVVARTCALLRCSLPPWREPAAFALLERDVRPHPQRADTLRITASFRNNATWPQAWPEVVLTLSDVDGRPLGTRAFAPAEYLGQAPENALVDSGAGAVIRMDVREPGRGAVAFMFDFR
ncbi:DUF3426 domain-containing protein [Luteimonas sp. MC1825]|uniref:DUF3426 domain-containing protein n=1 Tax=Luteimonas sp. MC1825 TaxID=2761107 RepID=UPI00160F8536|nr:DUF3426 domain-containing protein [Luteimonas sp. MC1825]MBB6598377.1 DUF3426 domain-containing protein [Luteimonas sp. MC1825]QOC88577.1 DUF3426 domain-containing protein [Luteimonas sp. MC1825]